ncbi:MAG: LysM protein [Rhodocyclaceae bacterium]|nr:LysM protein [Rhodocyclaceae bacterium]
MVRIISALVLAVMAACAFAQEPVQLVDNPPDRHIVASGDTLWSIAGKFLKEPWRWPEVWRLNKDQIRNPHRIYPGDIVLLDTSSGAPQLKIAKPVKLQPQVHSEAIKQAIPSIPPNVIEPFISRPLIVEADALEKSPFIIAGQDNRIIMGSGDSGFVAGIPDAKTANWQVYRPGKPLKDPENGEVLGHEATFLGTARLVQPGEPATVTITTAKEEIGRGDRLVPAPLPTLVSYAPHKPDGTVAGRVVSIYGGLTEGGKHSIVSLNRGSRDGIEVGHVLALHRKQSFTGYDPKSGKRETTALPEERYGLVFVFRTFERVAYALVMDSAKPVTIGDATRNP